MRMAIKATGVMAVIFGIIVEVIGVLYANDALQHNAYGWAGGILAVLGVVALSRGMKAPNRLERARPFRG